MAAETFAIALRRADEIPRDPLPWLLGVARRVLSTQRRSIQRRSRLSQRLAETAEPIPPVAATDACLGEALGRLSESDREALLLVAWEGLTPREAAEVVGLTPTGFSVRLHRARRRLRVALAREDAPASAVALDPAPVSKGEAR